MQAKNKEVSTLNDQLAAANALSFQLTTDKSRLAKEFKQKIKDLNVVLDKANEELEELREAEASTLTKQQVKALETRAAKAEKQLAKTETKLATTEGKLTTAANSHMKEIEAIEGTCENHETEIARLKKVVKDTTTHTTGEVRLANNANAKSAAQVIQLQKQVLDLEQKLQVATTAMQARVQELLLQSKDALAGETSLAAQLAQLRQDNGSLTVQLEQAKADSLEAQDLLRKANEGVVRVSTEADLFLQKTTQEFAQATSERSATQAALKSAEAANKEFQLEKETQGWHNKKATKANKKILKNLENENAELLVQLDRVTRRSARKLDESKNALVVRCSELEKQQRENTELKAASVAQASRTSELQLKCNERKTELKRVTSELRDRKLADQVLQEKFKDSESRMKIVEDSASSHKKRFQELHERFVVSDGFQQQDNVGGFAKYAFPQFASPQFGSPQFASPPPMNRVSRGFAGSPVIMAPLNAEDDTRSPTALKKVL